MNKLLNGFCLIFILLFSSISVFANGKTPPDPISLDFKHPLKVVYPLYMHQSDSSDHYELQVYPTLTMRLGSPYYGEAIFPIDVPVSGNYQIWALVKWPDACHNSFWIQSRKHMSIIGNDTIWSRWHWVKGPCWPLLQGAQTVSLHARESGIACANIVLVPANSTWKPSDSAETIFRFSSTLWARQCTLIALRKSFKKNSHTNYQNYLLSPLDKITLANELDFLSSSSGNSEFDITYATILSKSSELEALTLFVNTHPEHAQIYRLKHILARALLKERRFKEARKIYLSIISTSDAACDLYDAYEELNAIDLILPSDNMPSSFQIAQQKRSAQHFFNRAKDHRNQGDIFGYYYLLEKAALLDPEQIDFSMNVAEGYLECQDWMHAWPWVEKTLNKRPQELGLIMLATKLQFRLHGPVVADHFLRNWLKDTDLPPNQVQLLSDILAFYHLDFQISRTQK